MAAYRHQLTGALLTWLATSAAGVLLYWQGRLIAGRQVGRDLVTVAPSLELLVALLTGLLSLAHRNHLGQLATAREMLRRQALHDPLTGLGNRNLLHEHARGRLGAGETVSVLVLDLDGFKAVNDSLGHAAGDELLRVVARRLLAHTGDRNLVARLGGDEFVVMLHGTDARTAHQTAERLRAALTAPIALAAGEDQPPRTIRIDASIGAATARDGDLDDLLRAADADMYRVKAAHRILRPPRAARSYLDSGAPIGVEVVA
ncbi:GGDEF domain-containing protein [Dactylosporangium sp. NBC_01737]|uniref:GGDEF domain-containing protein n=1 Tax=Dactylosporangium sp. NBC_01737 TaxID=2975959 RepID=UPI002E126F82|nr:GGDEF domain-containing protein [Dactylosporangium sp. NBC_01737]